MDAQVGIELATSCFKSGILTQLWVEFQFVSELYSMLGYRAHFESQPPCHAYGQMSKSAVAQW